VPEAHFVLGRMRIHVHAGGIHLEKQREGGMPAMEKHVLERLAYGMRDDLVTHHPAVDIEMLDVRLAAGERRQANPAEQLQSQRLVLDAQAVLDKTLPADTRHAPVLARDIARRGEIQYRLAVV